MDEKTSLLICLGASIAANCVPCFEHYHKKASEAGLASEEILEAVQLANRVKSGAHLVMRNTIKSFISQGTHPIFWSCDPSKRSCCDS